MALDWFEVAAIEKNSQVIVSMPVEWNFIIETYHNFRTNKLGTGRYFFWNFWQRNSCALTGSLINTKFATDCGLFCIHTDTQQKHTRTATVYMGNAIGKWTIYRIIYHYCVHYLYGRLHSYEKITTVRSKQFLSHYYREASE